MYYDHFNKNKIIRLSKFITNRLNVKIARTVLSLFEKQHHVDFLEIGHGRGDFADVLKDEKTYFNEIGLTYFGIEPNRSLCEKGIKKGYSIVNCKIPPMPPVNNGVPFDCIYMSHVLEHFTSYEIVQTVLSQIRSNLKLSPGT